MVPRTSLYPSLTVYWKLAMDIFSDSICELKATTNKANLILYELFLLVEQYCILMKLDTKFYVHIYPCNWDAPYLTVSSESLPYCFLQSREEHKVHHYLNLT